MLKKFLFAAILFLLISAAVGFFFIKKPFSSANPDQSSEIAQANKTEDSQNTETASTPQPVILFDDQNIFTTFDSNLQIIYPSAWQQSNGTTPVLGQQSDVLQSVDFVDTVGGIRASIVVSEQYQAQLDTILDCSQQSGFICEPTIIANEKFVIRTSVANNPKIISATSIKYQKIYQLTFVIPANANQDDNIRLVGNIISTLRFF